MKSQYFTDTATVTSNRVLYTASSFARSSLLHLQEIGELQALRAHTSERSGLQSYLFFMVTSGSGTLVYEDNGETVKVDREIKVIFGEDEAGKDQADGFRGLALSGK